MHVHNGSSLISELQSALTMIDLAERTPDPQRKRVQIEPSGISCQMIQGVLSGMVLDEIEFAEVTINL
jgi:hypothetical protein